MLPFLSPTLPVYAYLDPGIGSILLQGLIAGLAATVATVTLYWNKVKDFIKTIANKNNKKQ